MNRKILQITLSLVLLIGLTSIISATDFYYTTDRDALAVMNRLATRLTQASHLNFSASLYIEHYPQVNAYSTSDGRIIVTQGLLRSISTEEELAGAIAHEMGHVLPTLQRRAIRTFTLVGNDEYSADKLGIQLLEKAGINPLGIANMLETVLEHDGKTLPRAQAHQISDRIHRIEKKAAHYVPVPAEQEASGL
ncbi:MAG: M48 family metallopeptidase [Acidobacteriia bacterium]|nr:M48 family metallopeptidase [Terriglobia bacterium]